MSDDDDDDTGSVPANWAGERGESGGNQSEPILTRWPQWHCIQYIWHQSATQHKLFYIIACALLSLWTIQNCTEGVGLLALNTFTFNFQCWVRELFLQVCLTFDFHTASYTNTYTFPPPPYHSNFTLAQVYILTREMDILYIHSSVSLGQESQFFGKIFSVFPPLTHNGVERWNPSHVSWPHQSFSHQQLSWSLGSWWPMYNVKLSSEYLHFRAFVICYHSMIPFNWNRAETAYLKDSVSLYYRSDEVYNWKDETFFSIVRVID